MRDPNGISRGSGFVAFSTPEEASRAVSKLLVLSDLRLKNFLEDDGSFPNHLISFSFLISSLRCSAKWLSASLCMLHMHKEKKTEEPGCRCAST